MPLITMKGIWIGAIIPSGCTMATTIANGASRRTRGTWKLATTALKRGSVLGMVLIIRNIMMSGATARTEEESGSGTATTILGWSKKTSTMFTNLMARDPKTQTGPSWTSITNTQEGICGK